MDGVAKNKRGGGHSLQGIIRQSKIMRTTLFLSQYPSFLCAYSQDETAHEPHSQLFCLSLLLCIHFEVLTSLLPNTPRGLERQVVLIGIPCCRTVGLTEAMTEIS